MDVIEDKSQNFDFADFDEETAAARIGSRIRRIRLEKGLSQSELGEKVGLNADRIQKYENGARKPKFDMLKQIATALGVETIALRDPVVSNSVGAMRALFEMEDMYNLKLIDKDGKLYINFDDDVLNAYLQDWYTKRKSIETELIDATEDEKNEIHKSYCFWKWSFPNSIVLKAYEFEQIERIKHKIQKLQSDLLRMENSADKKNRVKKI